MVGGKTGQKSTRYPSDYSGNSSLVPLAVAVMPYDGHQRLHSTQMI